MAFDLPVFAVAAIILASCGGAGILKWVEFKRTAAERELVHAERMKALELGRPLQDAEVARIKAESAALQASLEAHSSRTAGIVAICILVPLFMAAAAVGGTVLVLSNADPRMQLPLLCVIWGINGLVSVVTVTILGTALRQRGPLPSVKEQTAAAGPRVFDDSPASFREGSALS